MLSCLFAPRTIALIGASADEGKLAGIVLQNLRRFRGRLYAVTPRGAGSAGLMVCRSPEELPETVDLAVIVRPAPEVPGLVRALKGKARCAVVVSAGFAEVGETSLQEDVAAAGREAGVRLLGPNCLGVFSPAMRLDTFFLPMERLRRPKRGAMAVVSQSGAVLITVLEALARRGIGVSAAANYGNAVDIDAPEIYDYLADDPDTSVVIAYLESVGNGRRFIEAARHLAGRKPFVILKGGKGERGGSAVFSHTGRLAGRYDVFRSILAQAGIREADDFDTLIDTAHALASCRSATGRRVFILTNAGGPGVLAADACARLGLDLPPLPDAVRHRLREAFPPFYAIGNPTDLTGQVSDGDYRRVLDEVADLYDAFVVIALTGVAGVTLELGAIVEDFHLRSGKPVTLYVEQGGIAARLTRRLERAGLPAFPSPERAVRGLAALLEGDTGERSESEEGEEKRTLTAAALEHFLARGPGLNRFIEHEVKELLDELGLATPRRFFVPLGGTLPGDLGLTFPLVAKVASTRIAGKSDVGGVRTGIRSREALLKTLDELGRIGGAEGILLEEEAPPGVEAIVGGIVDPSFGPVVMAGLGGVMTEFLHDVAFALAPTTHDEALRLLERTRLDTLLGGFRGRPPADRHALAEVIVAISELIATGLLEEIDLNPVVVYPRGVTILDAKLKRRNPAS